MACQILKMKSSHLSNRIITNPELQARFGRKAVELRNKLQIDMLEAAGRNTPETVDVITKQLEDLAVGQAQIAQFALERLIEIKTRITNANKAKELQGMPAEMLSDEEKKFIMKHSFAINDNQDEEKKLFDQEQAMMQEYSRASITISAMGFTKAKADVLMQKVRPNSAKGKPAAAPPKGSPSVAISGSQVIIQNSPVPLDQPKKNDIA